MVDDGSNPRLHLARAACRSSFIPYEEFVEPAFRRGGIEMELPEGILQFGKLRQPAEEKQQQKLEADECIRAGVRRKRRKVGSGGLSDEVRDLNDFSGLFSQAAGLRTLRRARRLGLLKSATTICGHLRTTAIERWTTDRSAAAKAWC